MSNQAKFFRAMMDNDVDTVRRLVAPSTTEWVQDQAAYYLATYIGYDTSPSASSTTSEPINLNAPFEKKNFSGLFARHFIDVSVLNLHPVCIAMILGHTDILALLLSQERVAVPPQDMAYTLNYLLDSQQKKAVGSATRSIEVFEILLENSDYVNRADYTRPFSVAPNIESSLWIKLIKTERWDLLDKYIDALQKYGAQKLDIEYKDKKKPFTPFTHLIKLVLECDSASEKFAVYLNLLAKLIQVPDISCTRPIGDTAPIFLLLKYLHENTVPSVHKEKFLEVTQGIAMLTVKKMPKYGPTLFFPMLHFGFMDAANACVYPTEASFLNHLLEKSPVEPNKIIETLLFIKKRHQNNTSLIRLFAEVKIPDISGMREAFLWWLQNPSVENAQLSLDDFGPLLKKMDAPDSQQLSLRDKLIRSKFFTKEILSRFGDIADFGSEALLLDRTVFFLKANPQEASFLLPNIIIALEADYRFALAQSLVHLTAYVKTEISADIRDKLALQMFQYAIRHHHQTVLEILFLNYPEFLQNNADKNIYSFTQTISLRDYVLALPDSPTKTFVISKLNPPLSTTQENAGDDVETFTLQLPILGSLSEEPMSSSTGSSVLEEVVIEGVGDGSADNTEQLALQVQDALADEIPAELGQSMFQVVVKPTTPPPEDDVAEVLYEILDANEISGTQQQVAYDASSGTGKFLTNLWAAARSAVSSTVAPAKTAGSQIHHVQQGGQKASMKSSA